MINNIIKNECKSSPTTMTSSLSLSLWRKQKKTTNFIYISIKRTNDIHRHSTLTRIFNKCVYMLNAFVNNKFIFCSIYTRAELNSYFSK